MPRNHTTRSGVPPRITTAKARCRKAIGLMPNAALTESGVQRAIIELDRAGADLRAELTAMKVRRARSARQRIPRGGLTDSSTVAV